MPAVSSVRREMLQRDRQLRQKNIQCLGEVGSIGKVVERCDEMGLIHGGLLRVELVFHTKIINDCCVVSHAISLGRGHILSMPC